MEHCNHQWSTPTKRLEHLRPIKRLVHSARGAYSDYVPMRMPYIVSLIADSTYSSGPHQGCIRFCIYIYIIYVYETQHLDVVFLHFMCHVSRLPRLVYGPDIPAAYSGVSFGGKQMIYRRSDFPRAFIRSRHVALQGGVILGC